MTVPEAVAAPVKLKVVGPVMEAIHVFVFRPVPAISWPATRPVVEATVTPRLPLTVVILSGAVPATLIR